MNESASKLKDLKDKREKLELKLQNIPSQLSELESRRDALFDALAEGMKKERFAVKKEELNKEERRIQLQRAEYEEGITRLDTLIEELTKGVSLVPQTDEEIAAVWSSYDTLTSKIREINDEMQRYDLIHKHIEYVTIEKVNVVNTFKYRGTKETPAKKIVVHFYMFSPRTFYFISCDGKGGHLVEESSPEEKLRTGEEYRPFPVEYLGKNYDEGKRTRREAHTRERKREEEKIATQMKQRGFISMGDMMRESGYSYSGLYRIISGGKMHGVKKCNKWFAPLNEFNDYMKTHNAKGKKISERDDWDGCTELLKAIEKVKNSQ